jgi:site-specific DNA-methyltransferase (adenine-specific)
LTPYYQQDGITIYNGDALSLMCEMPSDAFGAVFTDPPYSSGARNSAKLRGRGSMRRDEGVYGGEDWIGGDNLSAHGFAMLVRLFGVESLRVTARDGHLFSFIDWRQLPVLQGALEAAGWSSRALLVWDKMHFGMGNGFRQQAEFIMHASKGVGDNFLRHDTGTVFRNRRQSDDIGHPTVKPIGIVEQCLSCVPGSVLDPFMGSGTTLIAAKNIGRQAVGIELEERYCEIAAQRLSQSVLFGTDAEFKAAGSVVAASLDGQPIGLFTDDAI